MSAGFDCPICEGMRWYRPASSMGVRPCRVCLEAGRPMLPHADPGCARCEGRGVYRLAHSRVLAVCSDCLPRTAASKSLERPAVRGTLTTFDEELRKLVSPASDTPAPSATFFGTTGDKEFLKAADGDRRFWPLPCDPTREYRQGMWVGLLLGLAIGVSLLGFALWIGIGIGGQL